MHFLIHLTCGTQWGACSLVGPSALRYHWVVLNVSGACTLLGTVSSRARTLIGAASLIDQCEHRQYNLHELLRTNENNVFRSMVQLKKQLDHFFSDIFGFKPNWVSYGIFVETCAHTLLSPNVWQYTCTFEAGTCRVSKDPHWRLVAQPSVQLYTLFTYV